MSNTCNINHNSSTTHATAAHAVASQASSIISINSAVNYPDRSTDEKINIQEHYTRTNKDLLAISVHQYRLHKNDSVNRFIDLEYADRTVTPTREDYDEADLISEYFSKRLVLKKLRGEYKTNRDFTDSPFHKKSFYERLGDFLLHDRKVYNANLAGLIYRLPEFYYLDDELVSTLLNHFDFSYNSDSTGTKKQFEMAIVTPIISQMRNYKTRNTLCYWVKHPDINLPICLNIYYLQPQPMTSLVNIWDTIFKTAIVLPINGTFEIRKHHDDFKYLSSIEWNLDDKFLTSAFNNEVYELARK